MTKQSRQKVKHLENGKSFNDNIKSNFHHFQRDFLETNKANCIVRSEFDFKPQTQASI